MLYKTWKKMNQATWFSESTVKLCKYILDFRRNVYNHKSLQKYEKIPDCTHKPDLTMPDLLLDNLYYFCYRKPKHSSMAKTDQAYEGNKRQNEFQKQMSKMPTPPPPITGLDKYRLCSVAEIPCGTFMGVKPIDE